MTEMLWGQNGNRTEVYEKGENQGGAYPILPHFFDFINFFFRGYTHYLLLLNLIPQDFPCFPWKFENRTHLPGFPAVLECAWILIISIFRGCNKQFSSKHFSKNILMTLILIFMQTPEFYAVFMNFYAVLQFL